MRAVCSGDGVYPNIFNEYFDFFADYKFLANEFDGFGYNHRSIEVSVDSFTVGVIYKF